ncbi:LolA family protein [Microbulbifer sp.]|uniref:LolA family protein n=1 Tax=Microbulbifer sp. TaxID=1908541 RepID=UPI003F66B529
MLFVLFFLSAPAAAIEPRDTLQQIETRLQKSPRMLGRFTQKKTLPQLPRPLLSSGVVALSKERGVSWRVVQPLQSHLIMSEEGAGDDALARQIANPLLQIFRGDFTRLEELFEVQAQLREESWSVTLTPRSEVLAGFIASIEVSGNKSIESIHLAEANEAITEMQLIGLQPVSETDPEFTAEFSEQ